MIKEFTVQWLDLAVNIQRGMLPVHMIERPPIHDQPKAWAGSTEVARDGDFYVPQLDAFQSDPMWVLTRLGQAVRVPVHAYRTNARSLAAIWGVGLQVGLAFMESFRNHSSAPIREVILVLGNDCTDLLADSKAKESAFRCYVGLAIKT